MRIAVTAHHGFDDQTRAYAEFRMFAALARRHDLVGHVSITLRHRAAAPPAVRCLVAMTLADGTRVRVTGRGTHPYGAIDRAAARVADVMRHAADSHVGVTAVMP